MKQNTQLDLFRVYCNQIDRFPILTKQEEINLLLLAKQGNKEAVATLTNANTKFVIRIARRYVSKEVPLLDLVSEGNIGLMRAIECFDVNKIGKFRLITYAVWWIKQKITSHLHEASRTVKTSAETELALRKLYKMGIMPRESLTGKLFLDSEDIRKAIGPKSEEQILELNRLYIGDMSFQDKVGEESDLGDLFQDTKDLQDVSYENSEFKGKIRKYLDILTPREKLVITEYYGLEEGTSKTLEELGDILSLSRERIRQIKNNALKKLKFSSGLKELIDLSKN